MAMLALEFEMEKELDSRVSIVETHIEHMRSDISDIKLDIRRLDGKVDTLGKEQGERLDATNKEVSGLRLAMERGFLKERIWVLLTGATILAVMAKGFKWI